MNYPSLAVHLCGICEGSKNKGLAIGLSGMDVVPWKSGKEKEQQKAVDMEVRRYGVADSSYGEPKLQRTLCSRIVNLDGDEYPP